jgi:small basic protein
MEALSAAIILLAAIAYLGVRIVVFIAAVRRKEKGSSQEQGQGRE